MIRGRRRISVLVSIVAMMATVAYADTGKPAIPQKVDVARAKELAQLSLADSARYEAPWADEWQPPDWWIQVFFRGQGGAGGEDLAVNSWTGDVWDMNKCSFVTTPGLLAAVAEIKRSFSAAELQQYDRLHRMTGECWPEEHKKMAIAAAAEETKKRALAVKQNRTLAGDLPKRVDLDHARRLLAMAVSTPPEPELDAESTDLAPMITFSTKASGGTRRAYEINPWTGGVWDTAACVWLSTPALTAAQDEIRRSFSPGELAQYAKARDLRMDCDSADRRRWARTTELVKTLERRVVDERQARELVVLAEPGATVGSLDFERGPDGGNLFYQFQGLGPRVGTYGYFAVNPWTGDVWNMTNCGFPTTPAFRKAQARIRQSYVPGERWKYDRLHLIRGECYSQ